MTILLEAKKENLIVNVLMTMFNFSRSSCMQRQQNEILAEKLASLQFFFICLMQRSIKSHFLD